MRETTVPMKVLYVADSLSHTHLSHKINLQWFKNHNFTVHVATKFEKKSKIIDRNFSIGVERKIFKFKNIKVICKLKKIIETEKYDVIHINTPILAFVTRLASIKYRKHNDVKIIYTPHRFDFYRGASLINWITYCPIEKFLSKITDVIIITNEEDYNFAKKHFKTKIIYIPEKEYKRNHGYKKNSKSSTSIDSLPIANIYLETMQTVRKLTIKEIQEIQLNILKKVASFCEKNKLHYFLGCGTLAGAVLEKGFFSWDDDIDILMPRKDYETFIEKFSDDGLKVLTCHQKECYYPYAKVVDRNTIAYECKNKIKGFGVNIDIFPLDGCPNKLYLNFLKIPRFLMMTQWGCYLTKRNIVVKIIYYFTSIFTRMLPNNFFAKMVDKICQKHLINNCKKGGVVCHHKSNKEIMDASIFQHSTLIEFEGNNYPTVQDYKTYLNHLYGDYTKDQGQLPHSHFRAYRK